MSAGRLTIALDFNGVVCSYRSGRQENPYTLPDPPMPGVLEALVAYKKAGVAVTVITALANHRKGEDAVMQWLKEYRLDRYVSSVRPAKLPGTTLLVDDRAIRFDGRFPTVDDLRAFKPWREGRNPDTENPFVVGITGHSLSGKDTIADTICREFQTFHKALFAEGIQTMLGWADSSWEEALKAYDYEGLKEIPDLYMEVLGIGHDIKHTYPDAWIKVLEQVIRYAYPTIWIKAFEYTMRRKGYEFVVIPDVRFQNEAEWVRANGLLVSVERSDRAPQPHDSDPSEPQNLGRIDHTFLNDGTKEDLESRVVRWMQLSVLEMA